MSGPSFPSASFGAYDVPRARRPGGLTAICVIAIVLGGLGLLGSLAGLATLAASPRLQVAMTNMRAGQARHESPEVRRSIKMQQTMQEHMQAVADRYRWPTAGLHLLNLGLASCLLAGGIMALNHAPRARALLLLVFAVGLVFDVSRTVVHVMMQLESAAVMSDMLPQMMQTSATMSTHGPGADEAAAVGMAIAKVGLYAGIAFQVIFSLAKLSYYLVGWLYLRRPAVRQWLEA